MALLCFVAKRGERRCRRRSPHMFRSCLVTQSCPTLCDPMDCSPLGSSVYEDSPGKNTGVGLPCPPPEDFSKRCLPHCRWILYCLSHQGSPRIPEWVAYPFSRGSSQHRNRTLVSCIAGGSFTNWAIREAQRDRLQNLCSDTGHRKIFHQLFTKEVFICCCCC